MTDRRINNNNIHLILPGKVSRMAVMCAEDFKISITEALTRIYQSPVYQELENEETKLWHLGPVALYQMFLESRPKA